MGSKLLIFSIIISLISIETIIADLYTTSSPKTTITNSSDPETCYQTCSKTYSLHTYPKSEHLNACNTGCRFYILSLLNSGSDTNRTSTECLEACSRSYTDREYYACSIGCNNTNKVQLNREETDYGEEVAKDVDNNQLFISPFHMFRSLFQSILNRGSIIVEQSSVSVYLSRNSDGESKIVVVQSEPEVVVHQYPDLTQSNEYDSETVTGSEERTTSSDNTRPKLDLSIWTHENPTLVHRQHDSSGHSWTNCFTYRSGVPRWILASVLFLAIFVLAWICCATSATAPEQHIKRRVGMGSDLKYLCLYEEPIKLVIDDKPPSYQELQAEQLPQKVDISKTESIP